MAEKIDDSKVKDNLKSYLNSLGKDDGIVDSIVDLLEKPEAPKNSQYRIYCKFYTIILFQTYCHCDDDAEVMLAAAGLLKGFEDISSEFLKCRIAYWKHAHEYNNLLKKGWGESTQIKRLGEAREKITEYLVDDIMLDFSKQNGRLNLTAKYKIPSVLELPSPRKAKGDVLIWPISPIEPYSQPDSPHPRPTPSPQPSGGRNQNRHSQETRTPLTSFWQKIIIDSLIGIFLIVLFAIFAGNNGYINFQTSKRSGGSSFEVGFRQDYREATVVEPTESFYSNNGVVTGVTSEPDDAKGCFVWEFIKGILP